MLYQALDLHTFMVPPLVFCPSFTLCNLPDPDPSGRIVPMGDDLALACPSVDVDSADGEALALSVASNLTDDSTASAVAVAAAAAAAAARLWAAGLLPPLLTGAKRLVVFLTPGVSLGSDMISDKVGRMNKFFVRPFEFFLYQKPGLLQSHGDVQINIFIW